MSFSFLCLTMEVQCGLLAYLMKVVGNRLTFDVDCEYEEVDKIEFLKAVIHALSEETTFLEKERDKLGHRIDLNKVRDFVGRDSRHIGMQVQEYCEDIVGQDKSDELVMWIDSQLRPLDMTEDEYLTNMVFHPDPNRPSYPDLKSGYSSLGIIVAILQSRRDPNPAPRKRKRR